nr:kinesin-like protein KIN-5C [Ipomoea batatas]
MAQLRGLVFLWVLANAVRLHSASSSAALDEISSLASSNGQSINEGISVAIRQPRMKLRAAEDYLNRSQLVIG